MRYWYVVLALLIAVSAAPSLAVTHGVTICTSSYNCGITDGVCPSTYGADCSVACDSDCVVCSAGHATFSTSVNANPSTCGCIETDCTNKIDDNGDGKCDYDSQYCSHGDISCQVSVNAISLSSYNVNVGTPFTASCTASVAAINSMAAYIDNNKNGVFDAGDDSCSFVSMPGTVASFTCTPSTAGTPIVMCTVQSARSYQSGTDKKSGTDSPQIVVNPTACGGRPQGTCADSSCDWCAAPACNANNQYRSNAGACVATGTCAAYACKVGQCAATCDTNTITGTCPSRPQGNTPGAAALSCNLATCATDMSACTESNCNDGLDSNSNGEWDYDTQDRGPAGNIPPHGEYDCRVGVTALSLSSSNVVSGTVVTASCTATVTQINSIQIFFDNNSNGAYNAGADTLCNFVSWSGTVAQFSCTALTNSATSVPIVCTIDTAKSYQSGSAQSKSVAIATSPCSSHLDNVTCNADNSCDWCNGSTCNANNQYSATAGKCVTAGACQANICAFGQCSAQCDTNTLNGATCPSLNKGVGAVSCNLANCTYNTTACLETTLTYCHDTINNDAPSDAQPDYQDATPGWAAGQSCNVCDQASCNALTGVNLPPYGTCQVSQPAAPGPSTQYMDATSARPGDATNLRMSCFGTSDPSKCWCQTCASGYSWNAGTGTCTASGSEASVPNGCNDTIDNDGNGVKDYNEISCSSCTLSNAQLSVPLAQATWTSSAANSVSTDLTGQIIPGSSAKVRYANGVGASPPKCFAVQCNGGYNWNGAACVSAGETSVANGCNDTVDNDGNGLVDYNEVACSSCKLADVQQKVPSANGNSTSSVANSVSTDLTGQAIPSSSAKVRYANGVGASPAKCYAVQCNGGYSWNGAACLSGSEASGPNTCNDTVDNDGNGKIDYNDTSCSSCTLANVQEKGPAQGTASSPVANSASTDLTGQAIPSSSPKVRYANSAGASPTKCYSVQCNSGYSYIGGTCQAIACQPTSPAASCSVNDDCGVYGTCGELCNASKCTAQAAVGSFSANPTTVQVGKPVTFTLTSSNPSITTNYRIVYGDGSPAYSSASTSPQTHTYASKGSYTATATVNWSGGSPNQKGQSNPTTQTINVYNGPSVTSFTENPSSGTAPASTSLTLSGTCDPSRTCTYSIDTDGNVGNGYEVNGASSPTSKVVSNLGVGSHTFNARVTDDLGGQANATPLTFTVNPDPAAVITPVVGGSIVSNVVQVWQGANASFNFTVSDNSGGYSLILDYGDGTAKFVDPPSNTSPVGVPANIRYNINHHYVARGPAYTATVYVNDTKPQLTTASAQVTATGLNCVVGSQTGTPALNNDNSTCCNTGVSPNPGNDRTCTKQKGAVWNCFAPTACFPTNDTICDGSTNPPSWQSRAAGTNNQARCLGGGSSCAPYNWSNLQNECCGSTLFATSTTFPAGNTACCAQANQCYSTAFNVPGGAGCFNKQENTVALCAGGNDENCNGQVDGADVSCAAAEVKGTVKLYDANNNLIGPAVGASVYMTGAVKKTTDVTGAYDFNNPAELFPGQKTLYATMPGYTVDQQAFALNTGETKTINLNLDARKCDQYCANDQGYCDTSCIGVGQCQPTASELEVLRACQPTGALFGLKKGTEVIINQTNTSVYVGVCCTVPASWRNATQVNASENLVNNVKIDTLVKYTRLITLDGKTYKFVISTW